MMGLEQYIPALSTIVVGGMAFLVLGRLAQRGTPSDGRSLAFQLIFWAAGLSLLVALIVALHWMLRFGARFSVSWVSY